MPLITTSGTTVVAPGVEILLDVPNVEAGDTVEVYRDATLLGKAVLTGTPNEYAFNDTLPNAGSFTYTARFNRNGLSSIISNAFALTFAPTFLPSDIASLGLWMDGADAGTLTLDGTKVTSWLDKASAREFSNATVETQPSLESVNFPQPTVSLANGTFLELTSGPELELDNQSTVFVVGNIRHSTSYYALTYLSGGDGNIETGTANPLLCTFGSPVNPGVAVQYVADGTHYFYTGDNTISVNTPYVLCTRFSDMHTWASVENTPDPAAISPLDVTNPLALAASVVTPTRIGTVANLYEQDGEIAELLVYTQALTNEEIQNVLNYLGAKWHTYMTI